MGANFKHPNLRKVWVPEVGNRVSYRHSSTVLIRIGELCLRTSEFPISTGTGENTSKTKQRISSRGNLDVLRRSSLIQVKAV